jgi:hypothetical protein
MCKGVSTVSFLEKIEAELNNMLGAGRLDPTVYAQLKNLIETQFQNWRESVAEDLHQKAREWEDVMGAEKEGFYSLGLRRSADRILGKSVLDEQTPEVESEEGETTE